LGDIEKSAETFNRRLNRYFEIMGAPGELAVLGYSRGTMISLEMLAQAKKSDETWLKNLRAMISVGGVTYGSALADKIAPHIKTFGELIEGLRPMTENTLPISEEMSFLEKLRISTQNAASIAKNSTVLAQNIAVSLENGIGLSDAVPGINLIEELKKNREVDLSSTRALLARIAASFDFSLAPIEFNFGMFSDPAVFNGNVEAHNENVRRYNDNLQKFQIISRAVALGIEQLSTEARLEWWRTHDVPVEGVKYYAIAGTMADPDASGEKTLIENPYSYNVGSPDQLELLANYRDFTGYSKKRLNDSQVAVDRVRFWPSLNAMLNSSNAAMKTEFLGVVGTHHWGLTLRTVIKLTSGKTNPFPREALLKSIAGSIALDRE
jgi:pimeloyl-ACP methyl ester carboxylesterase